MTKRNDRDPGDAPRWSGYTADELNAIRRSLPAPISDQAFENLVWHFEDRAKGPKELDINDVIATADKIKSHGRAEIKSIENAIAALANRVISADDHDGPQVLHRFAEDALKPLQAYLEQLRSAQGSWERDREEWGKRKRPNRENYFQKRLFEQVAFAWRRHGGDVNYDMMGYGRFFDAVVLPIYASPWVRKRYGIIKTDGMFASHVGKFKREK